MTKQEKIKDAYGKNYNPHNIDENGWMGYNLWIHLFKKVDDDYDEFDNRNMRVRPNSLTGIETNNGWIKIESEDDLQGCIECFFLTKDEGIMFGVFNNNATPKFVNEFDYFLDEATHYKPIIKPKMPLY
jgi:hypothetical protein